MCDKKKTCYKQIIHEKIGEVGGKFFFFKIGF
jgi:hypothetical protein